MPRFVVYSDIHHDHYGNGVTLDDSVGVEDDITEYAIKNNINTILMLGDWYRATNPLRGVIAAAEASFKRRSDAGLHTYVLPGNHDLWTKSAISGNAFVSAGIFTSDLKNITVVDSPKWVSIHGINFGFLPSGWHPTALDQGPSHGDPDVVLFHAMVIGSQAARGNAITTGFHPDELKELSAKLYLGGDNHTRQDLSSLLGTQAMYVGAPLQHTRGDIGQLRGWLDLEINTGDDHNLMVSCQTVQSRAPCFVSITIDASENYLQTFVSIAAEYYKQTGGRDGIVDITLTGQYAAGFDRALLEAQMLGAGARKVRISVNHSHELVEAASGLTTASTPEDKWQIYVSSGNAPSMSDLSPNVLIDMGKWALQQAKNDISQ